MEQQRRYKEPQDTLWGKFLSGFMAVVFAMSTLTLIPIASAINGEGSPYNDEQAALIQQNAEDQNSETEKVTPPADEQKAEPVQLLAAATDEDDADDAAPADVTLKVKAQNATVTYNGNDVATELVVPADKDVKFTVKAADGFTLGAAAVKLADAKGETTLTPNAGEYTVAADRVADGATIVVTAEAAAGSADTDTVEPSTPAPSTELGEKTANAESIITSIMSFFGGTSTLDARGLGNGNGNAGVNPAEDGSYPVYVYVEFLRSPSLTGNLATQADDLIKKTAGSPNEATSGTWYTLGKNDNAMTWCRDEVGVKASIKEQDAVVEKTSSMSRYNDNNFPLNAISSWSLHTAKSADSYKEDVTDYTWHLDGIAKIVKYSWKGSVTGQELEGTSPAVNWAGEAHAPKNPAEATLPKHEGYVFDGWTTSIDSNGDVTYTARYKPASYAYTVNYYKDSVNPANKVDAQQGWPTGGEAEYQSEVTISPEQRVTIEDRNYILDSADHKIASVSATESDNVISVVYTKNSIGTTDPTQPDNVADKYQATIKYVAGENGTVTGTTTNVVTLVDAENNPATSQAIVPGTDGITATPDTGYVFDRWTDSNPEDPITARAARPTPTPPTSRLISPPSPPLPIRACSMVPITSRR